MRHAHDWRSWSRCRRRNNQSRRWRWSRSRNSCRNRRSHDWRSCNRSGFLRRLSSWPRWSSWRCGGSRLLGDDRLQNVSGLGDVRQVNLRLNCFGLGARRARGLGGRAFAGATQLDADSLRLILFQRTGVCLLLGHPNFGQYVENGFTLDFQLSGQIVDSNLAHPPLCASEFTR
jgi:hypothetical protein